MTARYAYADPPYLGCGMTRQRTGTSSTASSTGGPTGGWEPVILRGGRRQRSRSEPTVRDFVATPITLRRGLTGAKPPQFCAWVLDLLGYRPGDTVDDLFPGTGSMSDAVAAVDGRLEHAEHAGWTQPTLEGAP